jgi:hypothetical protein
LFPKPVKIRIGIFLRCRVPLGESTRWLGALKNLVGLLTREDFQKHVLSIGVQAYGTEIQI